MKKTKIAILAALTLGCSLSLASPTLCGYIDSFTFNPDAPMGTFITKLSHDSGVMVFPTGFQGFVITDTMSCASDGGHATVTVSNMDGSSCQVRLHDGPWMSNPTATLVSCKGNLKYQGMQKQGLHQYTLNFS